MSLQLQFFTLGMMVLSGGILGMGYDVYRVVSRQIRLSRWLVPLCDLLYWLVATVTVFYMLYYSNYGQVRLYVFIGLAVGLLAYFRWCSKIVTYVVHKLLLAIDWLAQGLYRLVQIFVLTPLLALYRVIVMILSFILAIAIFIYKFMLQLISPSAVRISRWVKRK